MPIAKRTRRWAFIKAGRCAPSRSRLWLKIRKPSKSLTGATSMTAIHGSKKQSEDEAEIHSLIVRWAKAVREENREAIRADHDADFLMFDVPPPFLSQGLDAYMATWETFFSSQEKPVSFDFHDVKVTCGKDVAFATAIGRCVNIDPTGKREPLEF